jgi:septum formation protein
MKDTVCMKIILASGSPRRKKILSEMGYDFEIAASDIEENTIPGESPSDHVLRLSRQKAEMVALIYPDDLVIGADTAVVLDGEILGKPDSKDDAYQMLSRLSGKTHTVFTGLAIVNRNGNVKKSDYDRTDVTFNRLSEMRIREYIDSGEPLDKAGSYGIQGMGSFLVKEYVGEIDTVIGFPSKLFKKVYSEVLSCLNR